VSSRRLGQLPRIAAAEMTDRPWTAKDDEELLTLRAAGMKWHVVAKRLGRTEAATITRGVTLKKRDQRFQITGEAE
jgi:hypothetical protein